MQEENEQKTDIETILNRLDMIQNNEIPILGLREEDLIAELVVQKLVTNGFQRRVHARGTGTQLYISPSHKNIIITNELTKLKHSVVSTYEKLNEFRTIKLELVDDYKRRAEDIASDMFQIQTEMRTWDELEEHQITFIKLAKNETKEAQDRCENLIQKLLLANKVRTVAIDFYKKQYKYIHFLNNISSEGDSTNEIRKSLETITKKDTLWKELPEQTARYQETNFGFIKLMREYYSKWQELTDECVKYHNRIIKQEHKCKGYQRILYKTQQKTEGLKDEKRAALYAFDGLINCMFEYFPAILFSHIDTSTFVGKIESLKLALALCNLVLD